jgi:hypothetical protein
LHVAVLFVKFKTLPPEFFFQIIVSATSIVKPDYFYPLKLARVHIWRTERAQSTAYSPVTKITHYKQCMVGTVCDVSCSPVLVGVGGRHGFSCNWKGFQKPVSEYLS